MGLGCCDVSVLFVMAPCYQLSSSCHRMLAPFIGVGLIVWWMIDVIINDSDWWLFSTESMAMIVTQVTG